MARPRNLLEDGRTLSTIFDQLDHVIMSYAEMQQVLSDRAVYTIMYVGMVVVGCRL